MTNMDLKAKYVIFSTNYITSQMRHFMIFRCIALQLSG